MTPEALARLHAAAFPDAPWDAQTLRDMLGRPGTMCLTDPQECGFVLACALPPEAEILTLATAPTARRRGVARGLLDRLHRQCAANGITSLFLEVAAGNHAARMLYHQAGFVQNGLRKRYYRRKDGGTDDALILQQAVTPGQHNVTAPNG